MSVSLFFTQWPHFAHGNKTEGRWSKEQTIPYHHHSIIPKETVRHDGNRHWGCHHLDGTREAGPELSKTNHKLMREHLPAPRQTSTSPGWIYIFGGRETPPHEEADRKGFIAVFFSAQGQNTQTDLSAAETIISFSESNEEGFFFRASKDSW